MTLEDAIQILSGTAEGDRTRAWSLLSEEVKDLTKVVWKRTSEADQEDAQQEALLRIMRAVELGRIRGESDGAVRHYLRLTVLSCFNDARRKRLRELADRERYELEPRQPGDDDSDDDDDAPPIDDVLPRARELLERVGDAAVAAKQSGAQSFQAAYDEVVALAARETTVVEILRETKGVIEAEDPAAFIRARDALYQRHKRARDHLVATVDALVEAGELAPEEGALARGCIEGWLTRRQITDDPNVEESKDIR